MSQNYFFVDLTKSKIETRYYPLEDLREDLRILGVKRPEDLNSYDLKFFATEKDANSYVEKYKKILKNLDNKKICKSRELPALLYKRRYMIQTLLGEKNLTVRKYLKPWKKGDLINLHDQTFFLTVRLTGIKKTDVNRFEYHFELP